MGMYDLIHCRTPLPEVGIRHDEFQIKDTPSQLLEHYEIRVDATLWHEAYDQVDRSDPKAEGLGRLAGSWSRENTRWEREYLTGSLRFYGNSEFGWLEFEAQFLDGKSLGLRRIPEGTGLHEPGLRLDPGTLDRIQETAHWEEREACAQLVLERAQEAEKEGDQVLGLILRTLALRLRR